jgi:translation initiation factor 2B subunit (eIF-2B alpha/beta/delta family)
MEDPFLELAADSTSGATELIQRLLIVCENFVMGNQPRELQAGLAFLEDEQKGLPSFHTFLHLLKTDLLPKLHETQEPAEALGYITSLQRVIEHSGEVIARSFARQFTTPQRICTLSRSSTVVTALRHLHEEQLIEHLFVLESRPLNEGGKTIRDCSALGIPATLLVDAAAGEAASRIDCAVVGADCITADGFLLNKTGTLPLAVCCKVFDVPMFVLCDSLKFTSQLQKNVLVEDMPASEVIAKKKGDAFAVWNKYFEWMPVEYVTAFITEQGDFPPDQLSKLVTG